MRFAYFVGIYLIHFKAEYSSSSSGSIENQQCSTQQQEKCANSDSEEPAGRYDAASNLIYQQIEQALANYKPCTDNTDAEDVDCRCHADVISTDLLPYKAVGITAEMLQNSARYGTRYKIFQGKLYRESDCMFPARCGGVEHFLLQLLPQLPDVDFILNSRDWPQLRALAEQQPKAVVFSFSKTKQNLDIMYPAWSFWAGGPAISLHPTGIGRWDLLRESITKAAHKLPWSEKLAQGFFRGSRTSDERDALVLLSRQQPQLVDAQYTKNQAWKSAKDTLNAEPAKEVSFEQHCKYKFLFNFRGVAASFRFKHLFLCKSLVFHVGDEWQEFFYAALKPWVHYVPVPKYPTEEMLKQLLIFFQQNDELAQQIAQRGYDFVWQHLRMADVSCYWLNLLQRYKKLLKYEITYDATLNEIRARS